MSVFDGSAAMSNVDVAWLRMEHPTNLMMVTALLLLDRPLEPERLSALLEQRLLSPHAARFDRTACAHCPAYHLRGAEPGLWLGRSTGDG